MGNETKEKYSKCINNIQLEYIIKILVGRKKEYCPKVEMCVP